MSSHPRLRGTRPAQRLMAMLMPVLTCWMLVVATPGALEVAEDVAHVALDGHSFHDAGHTDPDHCCSGLFHFCSCHAQAPALLPVPATPPSSALPATLASRFAPPPLGGPRPAHTSALLRPPSA